MKYFFFALIGITASTNLNAQTYDFSFDDGAKKSITLEYDDPSYLPKWGIDVLMPSIMKFSNLTLGASLSPHFRVNKNLMIKGRFGMPFTEDLDGNLEKPKDRFTRKNLARDMNLMAHYKLISSNSTKKRKVQL